MSALLVGLFGTLACLAALGIVFVSKEKEVYALVGIGVIFALLTIASVLAK